ncbi:MAG: hypothetical protein FWC61_02510 [Proteobacteria bacterium]|nr:hypothetical protein [Pseudomonadota bacterium]
MKCINLASIKSNNGKVFDFKDVIESVEGHAVIKFNNDNLLAVLRKAADNTVKTINKAPQFQGRPNEFGNLVQWYFAKECISAGLKYNAPKDNKGHLKESGYPDGEIEFEGKHYYIEVKTYEQSKKQQTLRSFFYSPSMTSKITRDSPHLLVGFSTKDLRLTGFHFTDMFAKKVKLKLEFNTSNRELYKDAELL